MFAKDEQYEGGCVVYVTVTRIRGAYKIYPYTDHEYQEKVCSVEFYT